MQLFVIRRDRSHWTQSLIGSIQLYTDYSKELYVDLSRGKYS
ncbi:hypothetical protein [Coleofasciculus sp. FACHB-129]|nr:hypothetical protein [Coleofasciculus sp. FACHB-129]